MEPQIDIYNIKKFNEEYLSKPTITSKLRKSLPKDDPRIKGYEYISSKRVKNESKSSSKKSKHKSSKHKSDSNKDIVSSIKKETSVSKESSVEPEPKIKTEKPKEESPKHSDKNPPKTCANENISKINVKEEDENISKINVKEEDENISKINVKEEDNDEVSVIEIIDIKTESISSDSETEALLEGSRKRLRSILEPEPVVNPPSIDQRQLTNIINNACSAFHNTTTLQSNQNPPMVVNKPDFPQTPLITPTLPIPQHKISPLAPILAGASSTLEQTLILLCEDVVSKKMAELQQAPKPVESSFEAELRQLKEELAASKGLISDEVLQLKMDKLKSIEERFSQQRAQKLSEEIKKKLLISMKAKSPVLSPKPTTSFPRRSSPLLPRSYRIRSPLRSVRSRSKSPFRAGRSRTRSPLRRVRSITRSPLRRIRSRTRSPLRRVRSKTRSPVRRIRSRTRSPLRLPRSRTRSPRRPLRSKSRSPLRGPRLTRPIAGRSFRSRSKTPSKSFNPRFKNSFRSIKSRSRSPRRTVLPKRRSRSKSPTRIRKAPRRSFSPYSRRRSNSRERKTRLSVKPKLRSNERSPPPSYKRKKSISPVNRESREGIRRRRSPVSRRSRSPTRPYPNATMEISPSRKLSSPIRRKSQSPVKRNLRSPRRISSRSPLRLNSCIPRRSRSPKSIPLQRSIPRKSKSPSPSRDFSRSPLSLSSPELQISLDKKEFDGISLSTLSLSTEDLSLSSVDVALPHEDMRVKLNRKRENKSPARVVNINRCRSSPSKMKHELSAKSDMEISDSDTQEIIRVQIKNDQVTDEKKKDYSEEVTSTTVSEEVAENPEQNVDSTEVVSNPMHCPICSIMVNGVSAFEEHLLSNEHRLKENERVFHAQKKKIKGETSTATNSEQYTCDVCNIKNISSLTCYNDHISSKKHHRRLLKSLGLAKPVKPPTPVKSKKKKNVKAEEATSTTSIENKSHKAMVSIPPKIMPHSPVLPLDELMERLKNYQQLDKYCTEQLQKISSSLDKSIYVGGFKYFKRRELLTVRTPSGAELYMVPQEAKLMILHNYHRTPGTGEHACATVTERKIRRMFFWRYLIQDVMSYIKDCEVCISHQQQQGGSFYYQNFLPLEVDGDEFGDIYGYDESQHQFGDRSIFNEIFPNYHPRYPPY